MPPHLRFTVVSFCLAALVGFCALAPAAWANDAGTGAGVVTGQATDQEFDEDLLLDEEEPVQVGDPLEGFNRAMFKFNDFLYFYAFKPLTLAYKAVVFEPVRVGIKNAFYNLRMPIRFFNCVFQGKLKRAGGEMGSFLLNSTFGLGGLFDVAEGAGLNPPPEDFGQTLGTWGAGNGPYIVWPIFGPSTLRDTGGMMVDHFLDPMTWVFWEFGDDDHSLIEWHDRGTETWGPMLIGLGEQVNSLSFRLGDYEALKESSLDPYLALRDAYVQSRAADVAE